MSAVLETRSLSIAFGGIVAVDHVDFRLEAGELHALIGPNGAGKTTFFNLLTRFIAPSSGQIFFRGQDVTQVAPDRLSRLGLSRSFQISAVFPSMTALANVQVALARRQSRRFDFFSGRRRFRRLEERAIQILDMVGIADAAPVKAGQLSYGKRRTLELATTLALDPDVILLDEPMAGISQADIDRLVALLRAIAKTKTILMVEHNMKVVADLATRITVLSRGRILTQGCYREIAADARVREAYLGSAHDKA